LPRDKKRETAVQNRQYYIEFCLRIPYIYVDGYNFGLFEGGLTLN